MELKGKKWVQLLEDLTLGPEKGPVDTLLPEFNISTSSHHWCLHVVFKLSSGIRFSKASLKAHYIQLTLWVADLRSSKTRTSSSCYGAAIDAANTKFKPQSMLPKILCISAFSYNCLFQSKDFPSDGKEVTTEIKNEAKKIAGCVFLFQVWHWFII